MKNSLLIMFIFSGFLAFAQHVSSERKIKSENTAAVSAKAPAIKDETVHKSITTDKGPVNVPEVIDTNTIGTVSDKKNAIDETIPDKNQ